MRRTLRSALTSVVALAVLGCSAEPSDEGGPTSKTIEVAEADVSFELPSDFVELDPEAAAEAIEDEALMADLQERFGPDPGELGPVYWFVADASLMVDENPALVAAVPGLEDGHLTRLSMQALDDDERLTAEEIEEIHRRENGYPLAYLEVTEIDTEVGPAVLTGVSSKIPDPPAMHWASIYVDTDATQLLLTISTGDREKSEQVALDFADSLRALS